MNKVAATEFWRALKPLTDVFKADARAEVFVADAPSDDRRWYVPMSEAVFSRPLWISPTQNKWCDILMASRAGLVTRHFHPHEVFAYTISGKWSYLERDWIATAGDFVYETPGEGYTLVAHEHPDPMRALFIVRGPLIWLDEEGRSAGYFDVQDYIAVCRDHYEEIGIGALHVDSLLR